MGIFKPLFLALILCLSVPSVEAQSATASPDLMEKKTATASPAMNKVTVGRGKVTAKSGATLTVDKGGKSYLVETDATTRFRFKYGGKASLTDVLVNDEVFIVGRRVDASATTVKTLLVRDLSVGRHVFLGEVLTVNDSGWTMDPFMRDNLTVNLSAAAKMVNRRDQSITKSDVKAGDRVRVKGLFRTLTDTIEAAHVKDYELPGRPNSATSSATP